VQCLTDRGRWFCMLEALLPTSVLIRGLSRRCWSAECCVRTGVSVYWSSSDLKHLQKEPKNTSNSYTCSHTEAHTFHHLQHLSGSCWLHSTIDVICCNAYFCITVIRVLYVCHIANWTYSVCLLNIPRSCRFGMSALLAWESLTLSVLNS